jgi:hypothetical protein
MIRANQRSRVTLVFVGIQILFIWLLLDDLNLLTGLLLVVFVVRQWWIKDEKFEILLAEISAAVIAVSILLSLLLKGLWLELELWQLTTVVAELPRGARLLMVPVCLLMARLGLQAVKYGQTLSSTRISRFCHTHC